MPSTNRAKNSKDGHISYAIAILDNEFAATMCVYVYSNPSFTSFDFCVFAVAF